MKKNVLEYLKQTAQKFPDKIAIIDSKVDSKGEKIQEITFSDFYKKSLNFSTHMLEITPPPARD